VLHVPFFTISLTAGSTTVCQFSNTTVTVIPGPSNLGPFRYTWLDSTIVQSPHASTTSVNSLPGSTWYHVQVTSADGCKLRDSILIQTTSSIGTTIRASASPALICPGDLTTLTVVANPNSCGLATSGCSAANSVVNVGTATTYQNGTASQYPSPYGNFYKSAHHQFLIHASELIGQVPSGGQIKSIAFDVRTNNSGSALSNFTIKMACVHDDSLTGRFIALNSLTTVYTAASYLPVSNWNVHNFPVPYDWDGVSNIVVDVCYVNNSNGSINPKMYYTTTPFQSVWCTYGNDPSGQCSIVGVQQSVPVPYAQLFQRANMRFNMCITDLTGANLLWTPSTGPNAPTPTNLDTVHAHPVSSTQYQVALTSPNGCVNYDYVTVNIDTSVKLHLNNDTFICTPQPIHLNAQVTGTNVVPANVTYTWTASSGPAPPNGTGPSYAVFDITPTQSVTYIVSINAGLGVGCIQTDTMRITMGSSLPISKVVDSITCAGSSTGKININMTAGTAPYTYAWTPAAGNIDSVMNLPAGTYTVTVTDVAGCVGRDTTRLIAPSPLTLYFDSANIQCYNVNTGTVLAHVAGGRRPYRYTWTPAAGNTPSLSGLAVGNYQLLATDTSGCTISGNVNITQPAQLTSSATSTNLSGAGTHDGTITVTASGGTPTYTYVSVPAVAGLPNATGLDTGMYYITVTDAHGCQVRDTVHIIGPPPIRITFSTVNNLCYGYCNGVASANASGGVPPYTYHWSNPASSTTDTITGLCAGVYTVTVRDANGLTTSKDTTITSPVQIAQRIDSTSITCFGAANGVLKDSAYLGVAPYTYTWTPGGTVNPITNLGPGRYIVHVTDANNCSVYDTVNIGQPPLLTSAILSTDSVSCFGINNGYANVAGTGGTRPYSYSWSGSNSVDSFATDLAAGSQSVTVVDAGGCRSTSTFTIYQPTQLVSSASATPLTGAGTHDGTITLTTSGGTVAYTYSSVPAVTGLPNATGLDTGIYYITVTDARGCQVRDTAHITGPPPIRITFTISNVLCHSDSNGSITAHVSGGVPPYTYVWTAVPPAGSLGTGLTLSNLHPGTYRISVTDNNHITVSKDTTITAPPALGMAIDSTPISCFNARNGTLFDSVYGGTPPYTITWTPGGSGNPLTGLGPNRYIVNVVDANGCRAADTAYLGQPTQVTAVITAKDSVTCFGLADGYAQVAANGGRPPYIYTWSGSTSATSSASDLIAGLQTVTVTDAGGCQAVATFTIYEPNELLINSISTLPSHCATSNDGSAVALVSGGTRGYNFAWDGTSNGPVDSITRLAPGYHTVLVIDHYGCIDTSSFYVDTIYVLHLAMGSDSVSCYGYSNGTAFTHVLNGYAPYTFNWTSGTSASGNITVDSTFNVPAGPQTVYVSDGLGCQATGIADVGQPNPISDVPYFSNPLCTGTQTGKVWITAGSGTAPYTFTFNGGSTVHPITDTIFNLGAGTYSFTITDGKGCTKSDNVTLTDPPALDILAPTITGISCANDSNGIIQVNPTGGTPPYSYAWTPGGYTGVSQNNLAAGTYTIVVTDANGCFTSTSVTLTSPPLISLIYQQADSVSCPDSANGHIVVDPTGGTPFNTNVPYTYSLDGITYYTNHNFYDLAAGTYTVYVMDSPGCIFHTSITVGRPYPVTVAIDPHDSLIALGSSITLNTVIDNHSTQSINSYTWSPVQGLSCIDCAAPVATPYQTTEYYLTMNYGKNCTTTASGKIEVSHGPDVYVPNAFTPNGDGVNDVFEAFGTGLQSVSMRIFNRWGEKVFDSGASQWASWDGTYRGVLQPPGIYTYYIELVYLDGARGSKEGSITMIR
jgi:gliding motility-associated-like protein